MELSVQHTTEVDLSNHLWKSSERQTRVLVFRNYAVLIPPNKCFRKIPK